MKVDAYPSSRPSEQITKTVFPLLNGAPGKLSPESIELHVLQVKKTEIESVKKCGLVTYKQANTAIIPGDCRLNI